MIVSSYFKLGKVYCMIIIIWYIDHIFDRKTIIYVKILCHLAYDTLDHIFMIFFIYRQMLPLSTISVEVSFSMTLIGVQIHKGRLQQTLMNQLVPYPVMCIMIKWYNNNILIIMQKFVDRYEFLQTFLCCYCCFNVVQLLSSAVAFLVSISMLAMLLLTCCSLFLGRTH